MMENPKHGYLPTAGGGQHPEKQWHGVYDAIVAVATDPLGKGRVRLLVPQVLGNTFSHWAAPMQPGLNPAKGTPVFCVFLGGNPDIPYYFLGLTSQTLQNITSNTGLVINQNPYFTGNVITPWTAVNGTLTALQPNVDTNPPYAYALELTAGATSGVALQEITSPVTVIAGAPYELTAWVYYPLGGIVDMSMNWDDGTVSQNQFQVASGSWTYLSAVVTAPADVTSTAYPSIGPDSSNIGDLLQVEAFQVLAMPTARQIGGITTVTSAVAPTNANIGDIWINSAAGDLIYQFDGTNWNPIMFDAFQVLNSGSIQGQLLAPGSVGTASIAANAITSNLIAANAIVAGLVAAGTLDGYVFNGVQINGNTITASDFIVSATDGGIFIYGTGGPQTLTFTSSGTWVAPGTVSSVKVECWGGGGGGSGNNNGGGGTGGGGGGGGGEYAAENSNTCTAGNTYTITIGAGGSAGGAGASGGNGGNTTFSGTGATTVTAHGGSHGTANPGFGGGLGGAGGTGSTNSTKHPGGRGAGGATGSGTTVLTFNSSGSWTAPGQVSTAQVECWGGGGGGGCGFVSSSGGDGTAAGAGGGGGEYAMEPSVGVTPGNKYTFTVSKGGAGGNFNNLHGNDGGGTTFTGDATTVFADGGGGAPGDNSGGGTGSGNFGGGGNASVNSTHFAGGNGSQGFTGSNGGGNGGGGGSSGGTSQAGNSTIHSPNGGIAVPGGGPGATGPNPAFEHVGQGSSPGSGPGGGGSGGAISHDTGTANGGAGYQGQLRITYVTTPQLAGGGGGSGTASFTGTAGAQESGASAQSGGGPGGGYFNGATWVATPTVGPGGGGGGYDTNGASGTGAAGQVKLTYNVTGSLIASFCGAATSDPLTSTSCPEGLTFFQNQEIFFQGSPSNSANGAIFASDGNTLQIISPKNTSGSTPQNLTLVGSTTTPAASLNGKLTITNPTSAPTSPTLHLIGQTAGDKVFGTDVTGDASDRYKFDNTGKQIWTDGSSNQLAALYPDTSVSGTQALSQETNTGLESSVTGFNTLVTVANPDITTTGQKAIGAWTIPGNTVAAGTCFTGEAAGVFSTGSTPSAGTFSVFWGGTGGTNVADMALASADLNGGLTTLGWFFRFTQWWKSTTECSVKCEYGWHSASGVGFSVVRNFFADTTGLTTSSAKDLTMGFRWGSVPGATELITFYSIIGRLA